MLQAHRRHNGSLAIEDVVAAMLDFADEASVPAGMILVPREPTSRMLRAAGKALSPGHRPTADRVSNREKHAIRYRAMISVQEERP